MPSDLKSIRALPPIPPPTLVLIPTWMPPLLVACGASEAPGDPKPPELMIWLLLAPLAAPIRPSEKPSFGAPLVTLSPYVATKLLIRTLPNAIGCVLLICGTARLVIVPNTVPVTAGV